MYKKSLPVFLASIFCMAALYSQGVFAKASDDISISNAYVRAIPPGQPNSAAFMEFSNNSATAHSVVNASSKVSKIVELHTHTHEDGMMVMRRIEKIDIPANGSTLLKPGGLHIMLIKLHDNLKVGQDVTITLEFADGSSKDITAPVKKIMMPKMNKMH